MAGIITINFKVMKNGIADLGMVSPLFQPGPVEPHFGPGRYLTFEGFSVDEKGRQHYMDVTVAYRQTTLRCIEYLRRFGYSDYQIYLLLSCAPVQGHVAGIVDVSALGDFSPFSLAAAANNTGTIDSERMYYPGSPDGHLRL